MLLFQVRLVILFVSSFPSSPIDFILFAQGRCTRENCKYLHPPAHLKTQLEINGRNNLIQQKTAAAMLAQQMQFMIPSTTMQPVVSVWLCTTVELAVLHCKMFGFFKFLSCIPLLSQICGVFRYFSLLCCCISTSPLHCSQAAHVYPLSMSLICPWVKNSRFSVGVSLQEMALL